MENVHYALGSDGTYIYVAPTLWAWNNLPKGIGDDVKAGTVESIIHASFGTTEEECYVLSKNTDGTLTDWLGDDIAPELRTWITEQASTATGTRVQVQVEFGPNKSFIAWTRDSIRWQGLPKAMEETLQGWLSPAGWISGPPRLVALGCSNAWFILSEHGSFAYSLPGSWTELKAEIAFYKTSPNFKWSNLQSISFSASEDDKFVVVFQNTWTRTSVKIDEDFSSVADSYASAEILAGYKEERAEAERQTKAKREKEEAEKKAAERKAAEEAAARKRQAEKEARDEGLRLHYAIWMSTYEAAFRRTDLKTFPYLPKEVCICVIEQCKSRKAATGLLACRHDAEPLLRASGMYNKTWLRNERLQWHPDRFGRKCDPAHRQRLSKITTELYSIFEELLAAEA